MTAIKTRKTVPVAELLKTANDWLAMPYDDQSIVTLDFKRGVCSMIQHVLHESGNYRGFGYIDSYDAADPEFGIDGKKTWSRRYF